MEKRLSIFCHRQYAAFSGGHLKYKNYLEHFVASGLLAPTVFLENAPDVESNIFSSMQGVRYVSDYCPEICDAIFLAGNDWETYLKQDKVRKPVINLIQHIRHADPSDPRFQYLKEPAVRICYSEAVVEAIRPHANGPIFYIRMGHDIPAEPSHKDTSVYIMGYKRKDMAIKLKRFCDRVNISCIADIDMVQRQLALSNLARSRVSVVLSNPTEGFYLPGIEAMRLSHWAVVPDCIVNREYCLPTNNALNCDNNVRSCAKTMLKALAWSFLGSHKARRRNGYALANSYSLSNEREELRKLLPTIISQFVLPDSSN